MATASGSTLKTAQVISISAQPRTVKDAIGGSNKFDFYKVSLPRRSSFNATLSGLKANANVTLLSSRSQVLRQSANSKAGSKAINTGLEAGTYYIRISPSSKRDRTGYTLTLSTLNAAPALATNTGLRVAKGTTVAIASRQLKTTDIQQSSGDLVYTLSDQPQNGSLKLNGVPLTIGSHFTQADIDSNRLSYTSASQTTQITKENAANTIALIDGLNVAWATAEGSGSKVLFYNGATGTTTPLTDSSKISAPAGISGTNVIWSTVSSTPVSAQAFFYDGKTGKPTQITGNTTSSNPQITKADIALSVSGSKSVLESLDGTSYAIFLYDGATGKTTRLSTPNTNNSLARISGSNVVWTSYDSNNKPVGVFFYNGTTGVTTQVANNDKGVIAAGISGSNIVLASSDGSDDEIFFYNGTTGITTQLTNNDTNDFAVGISGSNVVWNGVVGNNFAVFSYNLTTGKTTQVTDGSTNDMAVGVSDSNIVWNRQVGTNSTVFFYNGTTATPITDGNAVDIASGISGSNVVWSRSSNNASQIFSANLATSDQFSFTVADGLGGVTNSTFKVTLS